MTVLNAVAAPDVFHLTVNGDARTDGQPASMRKVAHFAGPNVVLATAGDLRPFLSVVHAIEMGFDAGETFDSLLADMPAWLPAQWAHMAAHPAVAPNTDTKLVLAGWSTEHGSMVARLYEISAAGHVVETDLCGRAVLMPCNVQGLPAPSDLDSLKAIARVQRRSHVEADDFPAGGYLDCVTLTRDGFEFETLAADEWAPADPLRLARPVLGFRFPAVTLPA